MKKLCLSFFVIMLLATKASAQDFVADSIRSVITNTKSDSVKASALIELAGHEYWALNNPDTAIIVLNNALTFARQKGLAKQEVECTKGFGDYYYGNNKARDPNKGYQLILQALSLARQHHLNAEQVDLLLDLSN